jgi:hypothetical protein
MKFGIHYRNTGRCPKRAGFESAWSVEHAVIPRGFQSAFPYAGI